MQYIQALAETIYCKIRRRAERSLCKPFLVYKIEESKDVKNKWAIKSVPVADFIAHLLS